MNDDFYHSLVLALQQPKLGFDTQLLQSEATDKVKVTVKDYNLEGGLARTFFRSQHKQPNYRIKGPMGRGLGLSKDSTGMHIAYAAGTGVLVFIDLVARLALSHLGVIPET
jgi:hypothetical protein